MQGSGPPHDDQRWMQFIAMGMELAGMTIGCLGIGFLVDRSLGFETAYGSACGALIGFSYGLLRFIQKASQPRSK